MSYRERFKHDYGEEWYAISKACKRFYKFRCQKCNKRFASVRLDVHHIVPINVFLSEGYQELNDILVYGVHTSKSWHHELNLLPVCMRCHCKIHPHLYNLYRKMKIIGGRRVYIKGTQQ